MINRLRDRLQWWAEPVTAIAAVGALIFTAIQANAAIEQNEVARQQRATEALGHAVEQMGSGQLSVRLLGIHTLRRMLHESPEGDESRENRPAIAAGISQFIIDRTIGELGRERASRAPWIATEKDVFAALSTLSGHTVSDISREIDLGAADLTGAKLESPNFTEAKLFKVNLTGAVMETANFNGAGLFEANLTGAKLNRASFTEARLGRANLTEANLEGTDLTQARGLTQQQVDSACVNETTKLPVGLNLPPTLRPECHD